MTKPDKLILEKSYTNCINDNVHQYLHIFVKILLTHSYYEKCIKKIVLIKDFGRSKILFKRQNHDLETL